MLPTKQLLLIAANSIKLVALVKVYGVAKNILYLDLSMTKNSMQLHYVVRCAINVGDVFVFASL